MWKGNNDPRIFWSEIEMCFIAEDIHTGKTAKGKTFMEAKNNLIYGQCKTVTSNSTSYQTKGE